ncbi:MAG: lysophospholipid acyltransferase family protein [Propionicimonas sp.]
MNRAGLRLAEANRTPVQPAYRRIAGFGGWLLRRLTKQDWDVAEHLPAGAVIVVANHISNFDPPTLAHYLIWNGRWPRMLGKAELWRIPVLGWVLRACGQIPVQRGTDRAEDALVHAEAALAAGECVVIYPEGTVTADPGTWPMTALPGAARLALRTGVPVIPVGQWGANLVMPGKNLTWPRLWPKPTMIVRMGSPVNLGDLAGRTDNRAAAAAGVRIMDDVTALVAGIRAEAPPAGRYDLRRGERRPIGSAQA